MSKGTAVITGAANGIGQAYAQRLAADGFDIAVADVVKATATRSLVEAAGRRFFSAIVDVTSPTATQQFAAAVAAQLPPVVARVNNAGIYPWKSFADTDYALWRKVMGVNLDGAFLMSKAFVPGMAERKLGRIVNVASTTFWLNAPEMTAYIASKGGVIGFTRALASEVGASGITVNDLGPQGAAVAQEIIAAGGQALSVPGDVTDAAAMQAMVDRVIATWGQVDILVNNAGLLRDRTFAKMTLADFRLVVEVHLMGAVNCTKAVWPAMVARRYGRIVMTTSSSGLYGNFGQSNYGAAKMALVGLAQTLALEGARHGIRVNCLAPTAATGMTEGVLPPEALARLTPDRVSPALLPLVHEAAPTRMILLAGAGSFESAHITMTQGVHLDDADGAAEWLCDHLDDVRSRAGEVVPEQGWEQYQLELAKAAVQPA